MILEGMVLEFKVLNLNSNLDFFFFLKKTLSFSQLEFVFLFFSVSFVL